MEKQGKRNSHQGPFGDHFAPRCEAVSDFADKERIDEDVIEFRVLIVGLLDLTEESAADNAAAAPHEGNRAKI